jgi:predicted RNA-binding protein with PUA-like domain
MNYWLLKSEPSCYSIDDLERERIGVWDGVRNYQARNLIRDSIKKGDIVFFYHSSSAPIGIVGTALVTSDAYPDPTQFDATSDKFDKTAQEGSPRWYVVAVQFKEKFIEPLTLHELKQNPFFSDMLVTQRGVRLSVQPVQKKHAERILKLRSTQLS